MKGWKERGIIALLIGVLIVLSFAPLINSYSADIANLEVAFPYDVDHDGTEEIVVFTEYTEFPVIYVLNQKGKFLRVIDRWDSDYQEFINMIIPRLGRQKYSADLNGDGYTESLMVAEERGGIEIIYIGGEELWNYSTHDPKLQSYRWLGFLPQPTEGFTNYYADLDNDGKTERILYKKFSDQILQYPDVIEIYNWEDSLVLEIVYPYNHYISIYATDLNNDGIVEILAGAGGTIAYNIDYEELWVASGGRPGTFHGVKSIYASDIDGDGSKEVIVAAQSFAEVIEHDGKLKWSWDKDKWSERQAKGFVFYYTSHYPLEILFFIFIVGAISVFLGSRKILRRKRKEGGA